MGDQQLSQPTPEMIAQAAYLLWEREGRPHGRALTHWLRAERQLMAGGTGAPTASEPKAQPAGGLPKRPAGARRGGPKRPDPARL